MTAFRLVLLAIAVLGAVLRPYRLPAYVAPVVCSAVALLAGATTPALARHDLRELASPLAFLLCAIPLAVLLDRFGYFEELSGLLEGRGHGLVPGLWVLATATVAVLNLDAAVVLLTPLYVSVARRVGLSPRFLGFQPVILALLASSFLPVSNLTNLIATARTGVGTLAFLEHLALPGAVACAVGYICYRGSAPVADGGTTTTGPPPSERPVPEHPLPGRRVLVVGSVVVAGVLVGFVVGPAFGIAEWMVALAADAVLVGLVRWFPFGRIPWGTALVAAGLAVLAGAAAEGLPLAGLFQGTGPLASLRIVAVTALGANVVNNLPALLVALPFVASPHSCALWPTLVGVNFGPSLLVTGSLASLLWAESMRHLGAPVHARQFFRMGLRVGLPATAAATAVLLAMGPLFRC